MNRRNFLGSVLGIFLSSKLPFRAEEAKIASGLPEYNSFKLFACTSENGTIWLPPVKLLELKKNKISFICEGLLITRTTHFKGFGLCDGKGVLLSEAVLDVYACNGDEIHLRFDWDLPQCLLQTDSSLMTELRTIYGVSFRRSVMTDSES